MTWSPILRLSEEEKRFNKVRCHAAGQPRCQDLKATKEKRLSWPKVKAKVGLPNTGKRVTNSKNLFDLNV